MPTLTKASEIAIHNGSLFVTPPARSSKGARLSKFGDLLKGKKAVKEGASAATWG
jgi:hypothetical protein